MMVHTLSYLVLVEKKCLVLISLLNIQGHFLSLSSIFSNILLILHLEYLNFCLYRQINNETSISKPQRIFENTYIYSESANYLSEIKLVYDPRISINCQHSHRTVWYDYVHHTIMVLLDSCISDSIIDVHFVIDPD